MARGWSVRIWRSERRGRAEARGDGTATEGVRPHLWGASVFLQHQPRRNGSVGSFFQQLPARGPPPPDIRVQRDVSTSAAPSISASQSGEHVANAQVEVPNLLPLSCGRLSGCESVAGATRPPQDATVQSVHQVSAKTISARSLPDGLRAHLGGRRFCDANSTSEAILTLRRRASL